MNLIKSLFIPAALFIACSSVFAAQHSAEETQFLTGLQVAADADVTYQDENGKAMSFEQFQAASEKNGNFSYEHSKHSASFKLVSAEAVAKAKAQQPKFKLAAGDAAPDFSLKSLDGSTVDSKALRGRYSVVAFYFADCAPCNKEMPSLNAFKAGHPDIQTLAATFDDRDTALAFQAKHSFKWTVLPEARSLINAIGVQEYPTFALFDPAGKLLGVKTITTVDAGKDGEAHPSPMEAWVDDLLKSRQTAQN